MNISHLIDSLSKFREQHGDTEVEFILEHEHEDSEELAFNEIHDGYYRTVSSHEVKTICEMRMRP